METRARKPKPPPRHTCGIKLRSPDPLCFRWLLWFILCTFASYSSSRNNEAISYSSRSGPVTDTLILSDVHLGSEVSQAREAVRMLEGQTFRRLILLGDIFSDLNFRRLKKEHWQFLGYIRKLSNPKRRVEVVWVEGNHDAGLTNVMSHLVGVKVYEEYVWDYGGKKNPAGDRRQVYPLFVKKSCLSHVGTFLHLVLQKLDLKGKPFARFADR